MVEWPRLTVQPLFNLFGLHLQESHFLAQTYSKALILTSFWNGWVCEGADRDRAVTGVLIRMPTL
jgi:hypothetical protein